jgi:hypothetical protein
MLKLQKITRVAIVSNFLASKLQEIANNCNKFANNNNIIANDWENCTNILIKIAQKQLNHCKIAN